MRFTVENEAFAKALTFVQGCIPNSATIPLLEHVAITAGDGIAIRATNLASEAETVMPADVADPGEIALPGGVLAALVKKLPKGGQTRFTLSPERRMKIQAGSAKYELRTLPADDFPSLPMEDGATTFMMRASELRAMLELSVICATPSSAYLFAKGVYLTREGDPGEEGLPQNLAAVGFDGHRIARVTAPLPKEASAMPGALIPHDVAREMLRLLSEKLLGAKAGAEEGDAEVELAVLKNMIEMHIGPGRFTSRLLGYEYPDYLGAGGGNKLIPAPVGPAVRFKPYALSEAISRAQIVYMRATGDRAKTPFVQLKAYGNIMKVFTGYRGDEEAEETIECEAEGDYTVNCAINARYMIEMLETWPETAMVEMRQASAATAALFTCAAMPERVCVIMPGRAFKNVDEEAAAA